MESVSTVRGGAAQEGPVAGPVAGPAADPAAGRQPPGWDQLAMVRQRGVRGWFRRHPRVMNLTVSGIYLLLAAWTLPIAFLDIGAEARGVAVACGAIVLLLLARHRWPLVITVLVTVAEAFSLWLYPWQGAQMVGTCLALYCVGLHRGLRTAVITAVLAIGLGYTPMLRFDAWQRQHPDADFWHEIFQAYSSPQEAVLPSIVMMLLAGALSGGIGASVRRGREHQREILEWARRAGDLAQLGERNRIAREMHDVVAHSLSVMISLADGARVVSRRDPDRAEEVLGELSSTGRTALADMRRVIGVLRQGEDVESARRPAQESLDELFEGFRRVGLPLTVTISGPPLPEDAAFELTVHRIMQEALTNVLRYGRRVTDVQVSIEHEPGPDADERARHEEQGLSVEDQQALGLCPDGQVVLTIADDGLPPEQGTPRESVGSGQGIRGMGERAGFYRGSVYAGPRAGRGWVVRAVLEPPRRPESGARGGATTDEGTDEGNDEGDHDGR
ncbi:sensor histidine kinase [Nesterenkonia sp. F]|uniref:sensor histidine kinase n=1 Tax=Nesterenkonia sp. F TaxID=795955 RepID=UPI0011123067|nr:histidine kinase [Nesterenkonia sp. F]